MPSKRKEEETFSIKEAIKRMEEKYGKGVVMTLHDKPLSDVDVIPTGSISLDYALGIGGVPRGRIIEIYGPESSGKTTLALSIVAEAQKKGIACAYIDAEHALDPAYSKRLGVDTETLFISQPDSGEEALDITEQMAKTKEIGVIVIDSVASLLPLAEADSEMGAQFIGLQARMMSQALRKLTPISHKNNVTIVFINQIRINIGQTWGNPETTTGGKALKFYSSMRIEIRRTAKLSRGDNIIGNRTLVKVTKNKLAPPFKTTTFDILFNEGIHKVGDMFDLALSKKLIDKNGNTFSYGTTKLGVGLDRAKTKLADSPEILSEITDKLRKVLWPS